MHVLIVAGGTGGHIYPALALMEKLREQASQTSIYWVAGRRPLENELRQKLDVPSSALAIHMLPRGAPAKWPLFVWSFVFSLAQSLALLISFRPQVVVGFGSFHAGPIIIAARLLHIPSILCEQNVTPSLTNTALTRWAHRLVLSFEETRKCLPGRMQCRAVVLGNPVRQEILDASGPAARNELGLSSTKHTLLFLGGSHGARAINEAAVQVLLAMQETHLAPRVQYLLLSGKEDFAWCKRRLKGCTLLGRLFPYATNMGQVLAASDIAVCRSGAGTIAEITTRGLPAILIPYPGATRGHQLKNAQLLARHGAAIVIEERELSVAALSKALSKLLDDSTRRKEMRECSLRMGKPRAATDLAQLIRRQRRVQ